MSLDKHRHKWPFLQSEVCRQEKMAEVLDDIKYSQHCFVMYQHPARATEFLWTGSNKEHLEGLIALLCYRPDLLKFIKTALVIAEVIIKDSKKGMEYYNSIKEYIEKHFPPTSILSEEL